MRLPLIVLFSILRDYLRHHLRTHEVTQKAP